MIEQVRGAIDDALAEEIQDFWAREAGFVGEAVRARLPEVVCVLREHGALVGVSSTFAAEVPLLAGRRYAIFRNLLTDAAAHRWRALLAATYAALDRGHVPGPGEPEGLCALVRDDQRARPTGRMAGPADDLRRLRRRRPAGPSRLLHRRALGVIYEVENPGLRRAFPRGHWMPTDFLFIGENRYGAHVRVHYFPGVAAPDP